MNGLYYQKKYSYHISTRKYPEVIEIVARLFSDVEGRFPDKIRKNITSMVVGFIRYDGIMSISRSNSRIANAKSDWYTYTNSSIAVETLLNYGYIALKTKGFWNKKYTSGIQSVYEVTTKFKEAFNHIEKKKLEIEDVEHVRVSNCSKVKVMNSVVKMCNSKLLHNGTIQIDRVKADMKDLNDYYWKNVHLDFPKSTDTIIQNVQLTRIFKKYGEHIACGRFNQTDGTSYINIRKQERKAMLIDKKTTRECDYSGIFPNLLYNMVGKKSPYEDNYKAVMKEMNVDEDDKTLRQVIKIAINTMLNAYSYGSYTKSFNKTSAERRGLPRESSKLSNYEAKMCLEGKGYTLEDIWKATQKVHKPLQQFMLTGVGVILQTMESDIMYNVIRRLREINIIGLPIHDCIVCQEGQEETVKKVMIEEYNKYTGYNIRVEIE